MSKESRLYFATTRKRTFRGTKKEKKHYNYLYVLKSFCMFAI